MNIVAKGIKEFYLEKYLSIREIECKCSYEDCTFTLIHPRVLYNFYRTRHEFDAPIVITSGYRCQRHNKDVGGYPNSKHMMGLAIDLSPKNGKLMRLASIARLYFDIVIIYEEKNFIHCHNNDVKTQ